MWYKIKTGNEREYRGWAYTVHSTDGKLKIRITSFYNIQSPPMGMEQSEFIALKMKIANYNMNNSHYFEVNDRFLGLFVKIAPDIEKGNKAAKDFIDQRLGDFNIDNFYKNLDF
jgi:hypothetical protein